MNAGLGNLMAWRSVMLRGSMALDVIPRTVDGVVYGSDRFLSCLSRQCLDGWPSGSALAHHCMELGGIEQSGAISAYYNQLAAAYTAAHTTSGYLAAIPRDLQLLIRRCITQYRRKPFRSGIAYTCNEFPEFLLPNAPREVLVYDSHLGVLYQVKFGTTTVEIRPNGEVVYHSPDNHKICRRCRGADFCSRHQYMQATWTHAQQILHDCRTADT